MIDYREKNKMKMRLSILVKNSFKEETRTKDLKDNSNTKQYANKI